MAVGVDNNSTPVFEVPTTERSDGSAAMSLAKGVVLVNPETGEPLDKPTPLGYQQITNLAAAVGLTVPAGARYALIQCETQGVRWRDDGQDPTAAVGMRLTTTGELRYDGDLDAIKFIQEAANAKLNASYYG